MKYNYERLSPEYRDDIYEVLSNPFYEAILHVLGTEGSFIITALLLTIIVALAMQVAKSKINDEEFSKWLKLSQFAVFLSFTFYLSSTINGSYQNNKRLIKNLDDRYGIFDVESFNSYLIRDSIIATSFNELELLEPQLRLVDSLIRFDTTTSYNLDSLIALGFSLKYEIRELEDLIINNRTVGNSMENILEDMKKFTPVESDDEPAEPSYAGPN